MLSGDGVVAVPDQDWFGFGALMVLKRRGGLVTSGRALPMPPDACRLGWEQGWLQPGVDAPIRSGYGAGGAHGRVLQDNAALRITRERERTGLEEIRF